MAKIWQLNDKLTLFGAETKQFDINFVSNNQSFKSMYFTVGAGPYMSYLTDTTDEWSGVIVYSTHSDWEDYEETDTSAYKTVTFETAPSGDLLAWLQANAVAQDQPAVTTTRVLYKGKKELTMAQFEALASLDDAVDYDITDFPNGGITNAQMTAALGYSRLFGDGDVFVCLDNGTYTKGHTYQVKVTDGVKSWEDITISEKGNIKTAVYDNTTLADHISEILGYVNTENGGNLISIKAKIGETAITGSRKVVTTTASGTISVESGEGTIINAGEMIMLTPGAIRNGATGGKKITFVCANDTDNHSNTNVDISNLESTNKAVLSGIEFGYLNDNIVQIYYQNINILDAQLEHLVIDYFTI